MQLGITIFREELEESLPGYSFDPVVVGGLEQLCIQRKGRTGPVNKKSTLFLWMQTEVFTLARVGGKEFTTIMIADPQAISRIVDDIKSKLPLN
jgi:hypothetical protein